MRSNERYETRLFAYVAAAIFAFLASYLAVIGVWLAVFFRDSGVWDWSFLRAGLILLLYAGVFAVAARLVAWRARRRTWLLLAVLALLGLPLMMLGGILPRSWGYAVALGLLLILLFAAKQIRSGPR